jgi:acetamidase/formamidase
MTPEVREHHAASSHFLSGSYHYKWDNSLEPVLTVESGETIALECLEAFGGQFTPESDLNTVKNLDWSRVHCLTGPVGVAGADPGDILQVEILDFAHEGWAWTIIYPGFGLLPEDFGDLHAIKIWRIGTDGRAEFDSGIRLPVEPFCGVMGVALKEPGEHATMPPRWVGGNLDVRQLIKGTTVYFPVEVPQALFSVGDGHLAQGDGEICGTALETPLTVTVRLSVLKGRAIPRVQFQTDAPTTSKYDGMGYYTTTADGLDLHQGVQNAVRDMIDHLEAQYGLSRDDAYILCSCAGDLKIAVPVLGSTHASLVTFHMPRSIFLR